MAKPDRAQRLGTVLKLAEYRQQQASAALAAISRRVLAERERLDNLHSLQEEYMGGLRLPAGSACSVQFLQNNMRVIQQIDELIGSQQRLVQQLVMQEKKSRQQVERCWLRCKNLEKLQGKYREQHQAEELKKQLKIQEDDWLSRGRLPLF
jgi:flagellar export protein FliJ